MNNTQENNEIKQQLEEMKVMMAQLSSENQALQAQIIQQQQSPAPLQNNTNTQLIYPIPNPYYGPPVYNPNFTGYYYNQQRGRSYGGGRFQRGGRGYGYRFGRGNHQYARTHYCWTHSMCHHSSKDCQTPMQAHQKNATLHNRMGGSERFVHR